MELWTVWTHMLETALGYLTAHFGFSDAVAIIVFTLIARAILMPVSLTAAYKMQKNKAVIERIKPRLDELRKTLKDNPSELAMRTLALYRESGIKLIDKTSMLNVGLQGAFGLGVYQCLKRMVFSSKFLWIANIAKPDLLLTAIVAALMILGMTVMPGATTDTSMLLMVAFSVLVSVAAIAALPSAIGIYWATSNTVTVAQTLALRGLLARKRRAIKPF
jgi:YidC/Oxa1 family membrane protein insertase